ncbi:4-(cytidine 5'-diphospho)-2-C-methyl-D-erythritol kinase [Nocardioides coralli]|uniref:4-(cytidine 5'-diphospho)-2-C-methyl-D-erythritol kinase n=1 Tax=Nocardioides coralli TaxID=2872154 RepID=UPI001CA417EE|nr:4-(cytidine 5'-diphospho)-2-C-methyl-D-erythritol kinase [Nocardioides coralli]QZY29614.1 4-(cytidine 5'-diphospho)-2-C-methyl-D-erythritol kinase [Nocardioides coralli]
MSAGRSVTVRAPAKINLHLGVGAPREDGFHPLMTVYHAIGLYDDVTVADADDWAVEVSAVGGVDVSAVPLDDSNLVVRAGRALVAHHGVRRAARIRVRKGIPVAGGMAGGSADAAAALVALDRLWDLETSDADLFDLAAGLGSDVPFGLVGGNALGTGRGEVVEQLPGADVPRWWVVVTAPAGLSTPAVYRRFDELSPDAPAEPRAPHRLVAFLSDPADAVAPLLHNDLQPAALDLRPELADVLAAGEAAGALRGLVSGSGPTCVFWCADADAARAVAGVLTEEHGSDRVLVATGAVAGAHVVEYDR